jgi:hypothetical protein
MYINEAKSFCFRKEKAFWEESEMGIKRPKTISIKVVFSNWKYNHRDSLFKAKTSFIAVSCT